MGLRIDDKLAARCPGYVVTCELPEQCRELQQALAAERERAERVTRELSYTRKMRAAENKDLAAALERAERAEGVIASHVEAVDDAEAHITAALAHLAPLCESDFSSKAPGPWALVRRAVKELRGER